MRIYGGKVHDYIGMDLDYLLHGEVSTIMENYAADTI